MATNPPTNPPQPNKTSPIVWVLGIIAALIVMAMLAVFIIGLFIAHKVKQMAVNPGVEITKTIASMNPDVDVVSTDDARGTITIRDKKTGKTMTMNFNDAKKGKFTFDSDGQRASISASPDGKGGFELASSDGGSLKVGTDGKLPDWIPSYPGAEPQVNFPAQGKDGATGSFQFETGDAPDKVASFYSDKLKAEGLKITGNISGQVNSQSGTMITAENDDKTRSVLLRLCNEITVAL